MNNGLRSVRMYAKGKAPYLGVPYLSVETGRYETALFRREHLQAASSAPVVRAYYDEREHVLVLNGTKRAEWRLRDLRHATPKEDVAWKIVIFNWTESQRKHVLSRTLSPNERKAAKWELEIAKLERKRDKIHAHRPESPLVLRDYEREPESENAREYEMRWREEKDTRRKLGVLVRQPRKTWAKFYRDVAAIIGYEVMAGRRHDRVCKRKGGPSVLDYLERLYEYIGMAHKPYRSTSDPMKRDTDYGDERPMNTFERHRTAQIEYLTKLSERRMIDQQIEVIREYIAGLVGVTR